MTKINAVIVGDSINPYGNRITSYLLTYPRIIHSEVMTHRMFSRNAASSRAIPFKTMVKSIEENPFIPIAWQKEHKGMQGSDYFTSEWDIKQRNNNWLHGRDATISIAKLLNEKNGVTKQLCNRLLEPFQWYTSLVTATEYDNFFNLCCPQYAESDNLNIKYKSKKDFIKDYPKAVNLTNLEWLKGNLRKAEIHLMELAECMWDARNESTPKQLKAGEWYIPFEDKIDSDNLYDYYVNSLTWIEEDKERGAKAFPEKDWFKQLSIYTELIAKIATSMAARTSYTVVGNEKEFSYQNHIDLHDRIITSGHWSPMEHCAKVPTEKEYYYNIKGEGFDTHDDALGFHPESYGWFDNFHGFISYRYILEHQTK